MAGSTLSHTISTEIMVGNGAYISPFTISAAGAINTPGPTNSIQNAADIYVATGIQNVSIVNRGKIIGNNPVSASYTVPAVLALSPINLNNYGTIIGQTGIYLGAGSSVTNSGLIAGEDARSKGGYGIRLVDASLTNSGSIYGARYGIANWNLGSILNSGTVTGKIEGIKLETTYLTAAGSLTNTGTIYGKQTGISATNALIVNSGKISGQTYGVEIAWGGTFSNSGSITGGFDGVIVLNELYQSSNDAVFQNSGNIQGGYFGLAVNFSKATNSTTGIITGQTFGAGVGQNGDLVNFGSISGGLGALFIETGGLMFNAGSLHGGVVGAYIFSDSSGTNSTAGRISAQSIGVENRSGYLDNAGTISGVHYGLELLSGGIAVNSGTISGQIDGVVLSAISSTSSPDFLGNLGTVYGKIDGVALDNGTVDNYGGISGGSTGVTLVTGGSLLNDGNISGGTYGVLLAGGTVRNAGTIAGTAVGVSLNGGYVITSGTIAGATDAIYGQDFTLAVDPGAVFAGLVKDKTDSSTLNLSGTVAGTLGGIGIQFVGFDNIGFERGSHWTIAGNAAGLATGQTIAGFGPGDTIMLTAFTAMSEIFVAGTGLELTAGKATVTLDITGKFTSAEFNISGVGGVTTISTTPNAPCFAGGTRILTPRGEIAVEDLLVGDVVITLGGNDKTIIWIGRRKIDLRRHPNPKEAQPVCIKSEALGEAAPNRDLWVSPDHALYIDEHLIPAKALINNENIYQAECESVVYYHIELDDHSVLFAENVAVESYLETGNRGAFENGAGAMNLHPDFGVVVRSQRSCAMLVSCGSVVDAVRMRVARRFDRAAVGGREQ